MPSVDVRCLSGQQYCFQLKEDDTVDVLRQRVADVWKEPILARDVCVLGQDGEVKSGSVLNETEFTAVVKTRSPFDCDWYAHADTISYLPEDHAVHLVFVGDGRSSVHGLPGVGKTSLVFRCEYVWKDGSWLQIQCLAKWFYDSASVYVMLFCLASRMSFESVEEKWRHEVGEAPILLVGTKLDLCAELKPSECISYQEGQALARRIGALDYLECSALSGEGVDDVIDAAMWTYLMHAQTERGQALLAPLIQGKDQGCRLM
eukprot:s165_g24.t1